jgi:hypothetical protein
MTDALRLCESCSAPLIRKHRFRADGRSNGLEPARLFLSRRTCGMKCRPSRRQKRWSDQELAILRALYPYFAAAMVAKAVGRSKKATGLQASAHGIRKTAKGRSNAARYGQALRNGRRPASPVLLRMVDGPRQGERAAP